MNNNVAIVLGYGDQAQGRDGKAIDGGRSLYTGHGGSHVPKVPDLDSAVVGTGNDLFRAAKTGAHHSFSMALKIVKSMPVNVYLYCFSYILL